jgi:hypothetical protein
MNYKLVLSFHNRDRSNKNKIFNTIKRTLVDHPTITKYCLVEYILSKLHTLTLTLLFTYSYICIYTYILIQINK